MSARAACLRLPPEAEGGAGAPAPAPAPRARGGEAALPEPPSLKPPGVPGAHRRDRAALLLLGVASADCSVGAEVAGESCGLLLLLLLLLLLPPLPSPAPAGGL